MDNKLITHRRPLRLTSPEYRELECIRDELGMSRIKFAEAIGVKVGTYRNYRGGKVSRLVMSSARNLKAARE